MLGCFLAGVATCLLGAWIGHDIGYDRGWAAHQQGKP